VSKPAIECSVFSYSTNPFDFEIGGRNQNTQPCLKPCVGGGVAVLESVSDILEGLAESSFCFSAVGVFTPITLLKSSALLGVLGVFEAPKDANAPDPRPNALDAPAVGEARAVEGDMVLKGFLVLWEELSPWRLPRV